ncbi:MAG: hypothetical protein OXH94_00135 [Rhodospirillales bacterium]|nr:hypothetical protein [Rhodospirillales bacterium]
MQNDDQPLPRGNPQAWSMSQLENFGRIRLSDHFFMRDMLYSEVASIHGLKNVPDNPALAVEVGKQLCTRLLEPLHATFGHVSIRSAFRSAEVNSCGEKYVNVASTGRNHARHVWDQTDKKGKRGATASVVIPWFVDYLKAHPEMSWKAMGWWIHDHLNYSEVVFFHNRRFPYAAFNIRWHETETRRSIKSAVEGTLTSLGKPGHSSRDHSGEYPGFPILGHPNERYPDVSGRD